VVQYLIVDEAHRIKNTKSKLSNVFKENYNTYRLRAHRHAAAEQSARAVVAAQLSAARRLRVVGRL
jgi:hypothetical protein